MLESIYESSLCHELTLMGLQIQRQLLIPVKYKNTVVRDPLCLDILVENKVIIEVKATEMEHAIHQTRIFMVKLNPNAKILIHKRLEKIKTYSASRLIFSKRLWVKRLVLGFNFTMKIRVKHNF